MKPFPIVPRIVSLKNAIRMVNNPVPVIEETMSKLGNTYFFHMGGRTKGLITQDLEIITHILQKNQKNYIKSPVQSEQLASYIGKGLLTNNGASWLRQRRLIQPAFGRKNIDSLAAIIEDETTRVLDDEIGQGGHIDVSHVSAMLTFHIVARAIFSDAVSQEQIITMRDNIERVQQMIINQVRQPYKSWYYQLTGQIRRHHILANEAKDLIKTIILNRKASSSRKEDILQFLLDTRYEDTGKPMELEQLVDELLILMVAGHETTALSLTWTCFLLNQHPKIYQKLLAEIDLYGDNYMYYFGPESYLMAVIKESMRLYPPAWVMDRIGLAEDCVDGKKIPANTIILNFIYGLHRDANYWEQPEEFNPNRFLGGEKHEAYLPFGAGPRLCIGNHFAYLELVISLCQLLKKYQLQKAKLNHPGIRPLITLHPAQPIVMSIVPRKEL